MDPIEKLLFEAETISRIPKGARISTSQEFINIETDHIGQSLWRTLNRESRDKAVNCVQHRLEMLIEVSNLYLESKYLSINDSSDTFSIEKNKRIVIIKKIHIALANAVLGIDSLCDTYHTDTNIIAALKPLLACINSQISKISKFLMEIGEYTDPKTNQLYINILQ
jgi:hypothetical protein